MLLFINSFDYNKICFEDLMINKFFCENLFITQDGIYKKYKQHYYKLNNENHTYNKESIDNIELLVQNSESVIIKNHPLTYIPYNHYLIHRKTMTTVVNDNIEFVKEIDNDIIDTYYFIVNNDSDLRSIIEKIGLYLNNIIKT